MTVTSKKNNVDKINDIERKYDIIQKNLNKLVLDAHLYQKKIKHANDTNDLHQLLMDEKELNRLKYDIGLLNEESLRLLFKLDEIRGNENVKKLRKQVIISIHDLELQADKQLNQLKLVLNNLKKPKALSTQDHLDVESK